jgi:2-polyprenyl-6-methoxyphenol hydroxylase-like FAD-dependent oxidoreductase
MNLDVREELHGSDVFPQRDLGFTAYTMSRPLIELVVRRRLERLPNVELRPSCRVLDIMATGNRVSGVTFVNSAGAAEKFPADFIVDASGGGSPTLALLRERGQSLPDESKIGVNVGYATATFEIPDDAPLDWKAVLTLGVTTQSSSGAILLPIENKRWIVTLSGRHAGWPPIDAEGFMAFARHLRTPTIYNAIKGAKRLGNIRLFGFPESSWRHYEQLEDFPSGLLPIGDAICRFNPVYGQGMSVAALEARILTRLLRTRDQSLEALGKVFFAEVKTLIEDAWVMSTIPDFAYPQTTGERPADVEQALRFGSALSRAASKDPEIHKLMFEVRHLLRPSSALSEQAVTQRVQAELATL